MDRGVPCRMMLLILFSPGQGEADAQPREPYVGQQPVFIEYYLNTIGLVYHIEF